MVAIHAAIAAMHARSKVLDAFRAHGATAPERAASLESLGIAGDDPTLAHLLEAGVVRAVDERAGRTILAAAASRVAGYYLDEAAHVADRDATTPARRADRRRAW